MAGRFRVLAALLLGGLAANPACFSTDNVVGHDEREAAKEGGTGGGGPGVEQEGPSGEGIVDAGGGGRLAVDAGRDAADGAPLVTGEVLARPTIPPSQYCETIVGFFCDFYLRCGRVTETDHEACVSLFLEGCNGRYEPRYVALAEAGLLELSRPGVAACRAQLQAVSCAEQIRDLQGPCQEMWRGTQGEGAACGFDVESFVCAPGSTCQLDLSLCGTCRPQLPVGASCGEGSGICGPLGDCRDGVCVGRKLVGESCGPRERCETGARCEGGQCVGPSFVGVGDSCDSRSRCPFGSVCLGGRCTATSRLGEGCAVNGCGTGFCDGSRTCVPFLPSQVSCATDEMCASGRCDDGQCQAFPSACLD